MLTFPLSVYTITLNLHKLTWGRGRYFQQLRNLLIWFQSHHNLGISANLRSWTQYYWSGQTSYCNNYYTSPEILVFAVNKSWSESIESFSSYSPRISESLLWALWPAHRDRCMKWGASSTATMALTITSKLLMVPAYLSLPMESVLVAPLCTAHWSQQCLNPLLFSLW